ncbi:MAG: sensor domain-containing diguanylate cyclase [Synechococcales cyanobacterium]
MEAELPKNENQRFAALQKLNILDTPLEERFERITRMVCRSLKVPIAAISLVDESRQWFKSIQGLNISETPRQVAFCAHAILNDGLLLVSDATQDQRFSDNPLVTHEPFIRFYAGYPLTLGQDIRVGTLCAIDCVPRELSTEDQEILYDLSKMVESELSAIALSQAQIELIQELGKLEREIMLDCLTRLWNRLGIETLLQREWDHAIRKGTPVTIVMFDFDNFKKINDTHGHLVGDEVLQGGSRLVLSILRSYDAIGRWGGDEFMLILPDTNREQASMVLERIQETIAHHSVMTTIGPLTISLSMGAVSVMANAQETIEFWVGKADSELVKVKCSGKGHFRLGC